MGLPDSTRGSIFANSRCIKAWIAEARRIEPCAKPFQETSHVMDALVLLDDLYCKKNPQQNNPLQIRKLVFACFFASSSQGYPLGMFFEGLARKEGFGCARDKGGGQALIQVAALRKCSEALNYLGLCYLKQDLIAAITMLRDAAHDGHAQAITNFSQLAEHLRIQLRRRRKIVELAVQPRLRMRL